MGDSGSKRLEGLQNFSNFVALKKASSGRLPNGIRCSELASGSNDEMRLTVAEQMAELPEQ